MSQLSSTQASRILRNVGRADNQLVGITGSLATPGLAVAPPVSRGANLLAQVNAALGAVDNAASSVAGFARQQYYFRQQDMEDQRRAEAEAERRADLAALAQSGLASTHFKTSLPGIKQQVVTGQYDTVLRDGDPTELARSLAMNATAGFDPSYQSAYIENALPVYTDILTQRQTEVRNRDRDDTLSYVSSFIESNPDKVDEAMASATRAEIGITDDDFKSKAVLPAAKRLAMSGAPREQLDSILNRLDDRYATERLQIEAAWTQRTSQRKAEVDGAFKSDTDSLYNDLMTGNPNVSLDTIGRFIQSNRGRVSEDAINDELNRLNAAKARIEDDSRRAIKQTAVDDARRQAIEGQASRMLAGSGYVVEDSRTKINVGGEDIEVKVSADELRSEAWNTIRQRVSNPGQLAQIAAQNGYMPPEWSSTFGAGVTAANQASLSFRDNKGEAVIPEATQNGLTLFRLLSQQTPALLDKLPEKDRLFYEDVMHVREFMPGLDDDQKAMRYVLERMSSPTYNMPISPPDRAKMYNEAVEILDKDEENFSEVSSAVADLAQRFVRMGSNVDSAIEYAYRIIKPRLVKMNGQMVDVGSLPLSPQLRSDLPDVAKDTIENYWKEYGAAAEDMGIERSDVALVHVGSGRFSVRHKTTKGFVPGTEKYSYTLSQLETANELTKRKMDEATRNSAVRSILDRKQTEPAVEFNRVQGQNMDI